MPGIRHDGSLTLRTIDGKELIRLVVGVAVTHGDNDLTGFDVHFAIHERLVNPELLNVHFTAFFHLGLVFASFLSFYLYSSTIATMFKLNLRTQSPAFAEIVTQIQNHMR